MESIQEIITFIYGVEAAESITRRIEALIDEFRPETLPSSRVFTEKDVVLITYGDMVREAGERPLHTLHQFLKQHVNGLINTVHILPFYPYSSDDGFSVIDYLAVEPDLGNWSDINAMGRDFRLMFDAVINHISQLSKWFQAFLRGESPYRDYFTVVEPDTNLSDVFRPRTLPLLTPAETASGTKHVWTTFSSDQIDLNYRSPDLLLEILGVLLTYVQHGADLIRLDAIGFMWKEIGTRCLHQPEAHALIQLMRLVLNEVAPQVALVTETNVPHHENVSYFGNGRNEAQMVYNFSLPPLTLHAFHTEDATYLAQWAQTLSTPSDQTTFFNFCASHDGIGVTPARGILSDRDIVAMAQRVEALGGYVSYKNNSDGTQTAYELNISYLDALGDPTKEEDEALCARRFLTSQAIMLALAGVPGVYFHSLFGSQSWREGAEITGQNRTINRQKFERPTLEAALQEGLRRAVFTGYGQLLRARRETAVFHPNTPQKVLNLHPAIFALERGGKHKKVLCLHNVSSTTIRLSLPQAGINLLNGNPVNIEQELQPYDTLWYRPSPQTT